MSRKIINAILSRSNRTILCDILYNSQITDVIEKEEVPDKPAGLADYICSKRKTPIGLTNSINANYCVVLPGSVDPHVHYDDPGFEWREDFYTGTLAAAFGGLARLQTCPAHQSLLSLMQQICSIN